MDTNIWKPNPFLESESGGKWFGKLNVRTECQRALREMFLGNGQSGIWVILLGESGLGRSHTLLWAENMLKSSPRGGVELVILRPGDSYVKLEDLFEREYPDLSREQIYRFLRNDDRKYFIICDYPYRYVTGDLDATLRTLLSVRDYPNISVMLSLTPSQLASIRAHDELLGHTAFVHLDPLRKEETAQLLRKRGHTAYGSCRATEQSCFPSFDALTEDRTPILSREAIEYIHAVSGGSPRLVLIAASTLYDKARENGCSIIDGDLIQLVSAQTGYLIEERGCVLRSGLSLLLRTMLERFGLLHDGRIASDPGTVAQIGREDSETSVLEHSILNHMYERFGWDFNVTRLRLRTLVRMKLLIEELSPTRGWFKQYTVRG